MKKTKRLIIVLILSALIMGGLFWVDHHTHYKYNDRFIIGSSIVEITSKYGEFDKVFYTDLSNTTIASAGYLVQSEKKGFFGTSPEQYYMIVFDESGKAISVKIDGGWGG